MSQQEEPHSPAAPPPAAAPPPPPPTPPMGGGGSGGGTFSERADPALPKKGGGGGKKKTKGGQQVVRSYQRGESLGEAARPTIEHYGDGEGGDEGAGQRRGLFGSMRHASSSGGGGGSSNGVNRGIANSAQGGGTTLPELVVRMRILNMTLCTLALLFEIPSFLGKALFNPSRAVLSVYLAFFAGLLCCFELHVPSMARFVRSNFGLLFTAGGRAAFLFLMGGLCVGQGNMFELVLGFVMVANGLYTLYIPWKYPAFERAHEELGRESIVSIAAKRTAGYAWANPEWASRFADGPSGGGERESLVS